MATRETTDQRKTPREVLSILRRFSSYYRPHRRLFAVDVTCAVMLSAIALTVPFLTRYMLEDLLREQTFALFLRFSALLLGLFCLKVVFQYIVDCYGHILGVRIEADMRRDLFAHLQKMPFSFYDRNRTGHLMSRLINDLSDVAEMSHHLPEDLLVSFLTITGSFVMMMIIDVRLALIVYAFIPFLFLFLLWQRRKMAAGFREVRRRMADINARTESSISGIRVSQSFANEHHEIEKFARDNRRFRHSRDQAYRRMAVFFGGMFFTLDFLYLVVLTAGGYFVFQGNMTYPDILAFTLYVATFQAPMRKLANLTEMFENGIAGFERFAELLAEQPQITDRPGARELVPGPGRIEFRGVSFSYDAEKPVIRGLDLVLEEKKTYALVGPSGGGKTTICNLIPRFYEPDEGRITIDGRDIREFTLASLRRAIGLVSQDVFLFAGSIRENILYGSEEAGEEAMIGAARKAEIHDFIVDLPDGYDTFVGERGIRLSGGQKQRLAVARIFVKDPSVLLLDEATSALDNETEQKIQRALQRLCQDRTTLIIAHRLSTVRRAHRIIVLTDDGIAEMGTHEELLGRDGPYRRLYHAQEDGYLPPDPTGEETP